MIDKYFLQTFDFLHFINQSLSKLSLITLNFLILIFILFYIILEKKIKKYIFMKCFIIISELFAWDSLSTFLIYDSSFYRKILFRIPKEEN